jgi:hypothetical protein
MMQLNVQDKAFLKAVITSLINSYGQIGDNINNKKYIELNKRYFPAENEMDYYSELNDLMLANDLEKFKFKFDEYEAILKLENNYDELLSIYGLALSQFEINKIFNKNELFIKYEYLHKNR